MFYTIRPENPYSQIMLPLELEDKLAEMNETELRVLILVHAFAAKNAAAGAEQKPLLDFLKLKGFDEASAKNALAYLRGAGFLDSSKQGAAKKAPLHSVHYEAPQLAKAIETSGDFAALRDFFEARLNKLLNTSELAIVYSFMDSLRLTPDVIMLAGEYCIGENKASLRYIEKTLCDLCDKGIADYASAEKHFAGIKEYKSYEGKIKALCGFGTRALTKKEAEIVGKWKNVLNVSYELIELAYEKTIAAIKEPSLSYMNRIIEGWRGAGLSSPAEVAAAEQPGKPSDKSFDTDDFFRAAVSKTRGKK